MPVDKAKWWRRHRVAAFLAAVAGVVVLAGGATTAAVALNRPDLSCGAGMTAGIGSAACVGIDLAGESIGPEQPDRMTALVRTVQHNNDSVRGDNYVSIVLLLNLSPVADVDTTSYDVDYQAVEGAITAVWRANHTAAFSGSPAAGEEPKVKLFLANMGSRNADWQAAVEQIAAAARANHVVSVTGLGQSTDNTRWAITRLTTRYHLPVIGATVTGDTMNFSMTDQKTLLNGFFRVAPTNSDTVSAAARYITTGLKIPLSQVAIVEDAVASDDYITTLVKAAHRYLGTAHRFPFTSPDINAGDQARTESLRGQFGYLDINLCAAHPKVVYFAGRGTDISTFVHTWTESATDCGNQPLLLLTGDDGLEAVGDSYLAQVLGNSDIKVQYTGLASPDKLGPCTAAPAAGSDRQNYDQFQAAFTGERSCDTAPPTPADGARPPGYRVEDLDNGQSMLTHDAVGLAITTARRTGASALTDPMSQIGVLQQTRCRTVFHGASGVIQFSADPRYYGNPIGTVLPIENLTKDKRAVTVPPGWSTGGPSPTAGC